MKILELRFKNLNSLYGEWCLDFTDPEYVSNGIFALTGPTGAGKSTILDAICLALYGATPRLGRITDSSNEIMSRQTGECYAEVLFESQAGKFRAHWEQRCARKKATGKLQPPEHQVAEAGTGKLLEAKKSRVVAVIEEKTGMDFERFTRSILLAQGGFDTFLKADVEQKSKILEQITGTGIYSKISQSVYERNRREKNGLEILQAETAGIVILEPEKERNVKEELGEKERQLTEVDLKRKELDKAVRWRADLDGLKIALSKLLEGEVDLKDDMVALEIDFKMCEKALGSAEGQCTRVKEKEKGALDLIRVVHLLDQKLEDQKATVQGGAEVCVQLAGKIKGLKDDQLEVVKKRSEIIEALGFAEGYLREHSEDEVLVSSLNVIEEQARNLYHKQADIIKEESYVERSRIGFKGLLDKLKKLAQQESDYRYNLEKEAKAVADEKNSLLSLLKGRRLREYRFEQSALLRELNLLVKIRELKEERAKLEDDKACPLCGSREHPYAEGNIPLLDGVEKRIKLLGSLIEKAEDSEERINQFEESEKTSRKILEGNERELELASKDKDNLGKALLELEEKLDYDKSELLKIKEALLIRLRPLDIEGFSDLDSLVLVGFLKKRLGEWLEQIRKKEISREALARLDIELKGQSGVLDAWSGNLVERERELSCFKDVYGKGLAERRELYGEKKPDEEENNLRKRVKVIELEKKEARNLRDGASHKLAIKRAEAGILMERIRKITSELEEGGSGFKCFLEGQLKTTEVGLNSLVQKKDKELQQLMEQIAALKHIVREHSLAEERLKGRLGAIDAQRKECQRWEKLNELIGSADGKKYRKFAQGLTFEMVVFHANQQLKKMTDRYQLIHDGKHPLELNVIDNYQAGEVRSSKNLSGGEGFIVSLTLALGLSKMASRKVRVDSLFLDEGFGTLDDESLECALEALSGLQQEGKLIAVVSHVLALKERISAQISVSPVSGGKSELRGPGCRSL